MNIREWCWYHMRTAHGATCPPPPWIIQTAIFGQKAGNIRANHLNFVQAMDKNIRARDFSPPPPPAPTETRPLRLWSVLKRYEEKNWHDVSLDSSLHILILYVIALFSILIKTGCPQMEIARWKLIRLNTYGWYNIHAHEETRYWKAKEKNTENTVPSHNNNIIGIMFTCNVRQLVCFIDIIMFVGVRKLVIHKK